MKKIIVLTGNPLSTQSLYGQSGRIRFMKTNARERKEHYQFEAREQWREKPLEGNVKLDIWLYFGDRRKRDYDNFGKLMNDALTNIVWHDDSQVNDARIRLSYDKKNPRIEITIL